MTFWCRIHQSKLKLLCNQLRRHYAQIPQASLLKNSSPCVSETPISGFCKMPTDFCQNVRFFAAPVQARLKKEENDTNGPRLNEQIKAQFVRIVRDEGHNIVPLFEALAQARKLDLDLVEVQRNADPPVCKLMDFNKEKYKQQVREKEKAAKSKSQLTLKRGGFKEVKFSGKTEDKDLRMKADMVKRLMDHGYRVKCTVVATQKKAVKQGEEEDLGALLSRLTTLIEDVSITESKPQIEEKQAHVIVRHVKFGAPKSGGTKKLKDAKKGRETENEVVTDEDNQPDNNVWSVADSTDDFDFDFDGNAKRPHINPVEETAITHSIHSCPSNFNVLNSQPRLGQDSMGAQIFPSSPLGSSLGTENRYKRSAPTSLDGRGREKRDPFRFQSQSSNQRRQPQSENTSTFRNFKAPPNEIPKQEPSHSDAMSPSGYGIFSPSKASAREKQGTAAEAIGSGGNRYDSARNSNPGYDSARNSNPGSSQRSSKSYSGQRPDDDRVRQGGWGIFSRDAPNMNQSRTSK